MIYVGFMINFFLADTSELLAVLPISASWAQKRLIPTLGPSCTSNSWENFFRPIRANWWVLDSFRPREPKNVSFLLSRHHVRPVHEKFSFADSSDLMGIRLISASWPKNVCFLLSDMMYVEFMKNFLLRPFGRAIGCFTHFGLLSPKTFLSYFLDNMYFEFMKNIFSPIRASWWVLDSFRPPEPKYVWFLLSRHDVRRVHEKFFSRRFERTIRC